MEFAQLAFVVELLHVEEFARVDDRFHHHVFQAGRLREFDDLFAVLDRRRHGHGAGDVFASLQRRDGLFGVIGDRCIDVDRINFRILEELVVALVTLLDAVLVTDLIERGFGPLTDGRHVGVWVALIDWDEFRPESETDDSNVNFLHNPSLNQTWPPFACMNTVNFVYDYVMLSATERDQWLADIRPGGMRELFEHLPNTLFFVKDSQTRLMAGNQAFVERCGYVSETKMIGHVDKDIFPEELATKYAADDREVIQTGKSLIGMVELFPNQLGDPEWYITDKVPVYTANGELAGLCGTVRSYEGARAALQPYLDLVPVIDHLKEHFRGNVSIPAMAQLAGVSMRVLQRRFQETLKTTPREFIMKLRIHAACELLNKSQANMTDVAMQVGFYDHSVFSRQFSRLMGISPSAYRRRSKTG